MERDLAIVYKLPGLEDEAEGEGSLWPYPKTGSISTYQKIAINSWIERTFGILVYHRTGIYRRNIFMDAPLQCISKVICIKFLLTLATWLAHVHMHSVAMIITWVICSRHTLNQRGRFYLTANFLWLRGSMIHWFILKLSRGIQLGNCAALTWSLNSKAW